jgi:hypothetical protein
MNFSTDSLWLEVSVMTSIFAFGLIFFGHFEEGAPKWRRALKIPLLTGLACAISAFLGRFWFFAFLALLAGFVLYVHAWVLPRKHGINGWTGEPRNKYYALRGWKLPSSEPPQ